MPKSVITEGRTSIEAIEKGLKELKASRNQVDVKILEEKKKSFFSILDPHIVKVELTLKEEKVDTPFEKKKKEDVKQEKRLASQEEINVAREKIESFLSSFLAKISNEIIYEISEERDAIDVCIKGDAATKLIGYRGEALNSLKVILSTIANKDREQGIKVILDIGNYKETRKATLEELANKLEKTVIKTGKSVTLEPMTPYERKIIHTQLQDSEYVKTYSIGENDRRRVVISKK